MLKFLVFPLTLSFYFFHHVLNIYDLSALIYYLKKKLCNLTDTLYANRRILSIYKLGRRYGRRLTTQTKKPLLTKGRDAWNLTRDDCLCIVFSLAISVIEEASLLLTFSPRDTSIVEVQKTLIRGAESTAYAASAAAITLSIKMKSIYWIELV